jgi:hypothetical protein
MAASIAGINKILTVSGVATNYNGKLLIETWKRGTAQDKGILLPKRTFLASTSEATRLARFEVPQDGNEVIST